MVSKKRCLPCVASRMKRIKLITKIGGKALLRLGGTGKITGGILHLRHHPDDGPNADRSGKLCENSDWANYSWNDAQLIWCTITVHDSVTANSSLLSPTGGVKSFPPNTEKWLRKRYDENDYNNMSNETKRETNYSMNNK